jgi:hypothetical protein
MDYNKNGYRQMRSRFHVAGLCFLALSSTLLTSCFKDEYFNLQGKDLQANWNPDWALPLVNTTIDVGDVLDRFNDDDLIVIDPSNGQLALVYHSTVFSLRADQFLILPDDNVVAPYPLQATDIAAISAGNHTVGIPPVNLSYNPPNGANLTQIDFSGGNLIVNLGNNTPYSGSVTLSLPSLTQSGSPFNQTVPFTGAGGSASFPLAGWSLDLSAGGGNQFALGGSITFNGPDAGGVVGQLLNVDVGLQAITFSRVLGYLGQQPVATGLDSVRLRIFDQAYSGTIIYDQPTLTASFINGVGCPMSVTINTFDTHSDFNPPMTITGLGPVEQITAPTVEGQTSTSVFTLDQSNSNIVAVLASTPDAIMYDVDGLTNPAGGPASNFVIDSSRLQLDVDVRLPLIGRAVDFAKIDTVDFIIEDPVDSNGTISFGNSNIKVEEIEYVQMRIQIDNGFPAEGIAQAYFTDSNYVIIDSLFHGPQAYLFEAAQIDGNGIVTARTSKTTDIRITQAQLDNLVANNSTYIILDGKVAETNNQGATTVRILESYSTQIFLGVRVKYKATFEF